MGYLDRDLVHQRVQAYTQCRPPADTTDNLVRLTVKLPEASVQTIVDELRAAASTHTHKPGFVEFYEAPRRVIRIVIGN